MDPVNILIVDDLPENLLALESLLESPDVRILRAYSGNEALGIAAQNDLALILLDVQMPGMDGFETAELLRSRPKTKQIPIIFVSAINREQRHVFTGYEKGAVDYLFKPIDTEIMQSKVAVFVRLHRQTQELRAVNSQLQAEMEENQHAQETRRSLEAQLQEARRLEAIGRLAGGIAHDFNNILSPIIGFTEMTLEDIPEESPARHNLQSVLEAAHRARHLVQQILIFSRRSEKDKSAVRLQSVLSEAIKLLRVTLPDGVRMEEQISPTCPPVMGDPTQLHQVVMNLCTNALHAMAQGGGCLSISLEPTTRPKPEGADGSLLSPREYVRLQVSDTGCGMSSQILEKIFEPYFTTRALNKGTGLGLAVVHGIIKNYGGEIAVHSLPGKGSTFVIDLPSCPAETIEPSRPVSTPTAEIPQGTEHILLVDDEPGVLAMGQQLLKRLGYIVTAFTNPSQALDTFHQDPSLFQLLITDHAMPEMNGRELARAIHSLRPDLPVILCSGFNELQSENTEPNNDITAYAQKPLPLREMAQLVRHVLDGA